MGSTIGVCGMYNINLEKYLRPADIPLFNFKFMWNFFAFPLASVLNII